MTWEKLQEKALAQKSYEVLIEKFPKSARRRKYFFPEGKISRRQAVLKGR